MGQQQDHGYDGQEQHRGRGPGHTVRAGFGPQGEHPSTRPPRTPPQFRPEAPPREDGGRVAPQQYAQPGFTPAYQQPGRAPGNPGGDPWAASTGGSWQPSSSPQALRQPYQQPRDPYPPQQPAWQQPYPPQYAPQPQYGRQPPPGSRHTARNVIAVIGGVISLIIVISVAANSGKGTQTAGSPQAVPSAQGAAPASTAAAQAVAKTVATFSGSGLTNTPQFTVTSTWKLEYSFDCSDFGQSGNFIVMEDGSFGAMAVDALALHKAGTSYAYDDAGTHYLEVNTECAWTAKVIDEG